MNQDDLLEIIQTAGFGKSQRLRDLYWMLKKFKFHSAEVEWLHKEVVQCLSLHALEKLAKEAEGVK